MKKVIEEIVRKHMDKLLSESLKNYRVEYSVYIYPDGSRVRITLTIYNVLTKREIHEACIGKTERELDECISKKIEEFNKNNVIPTISIDTDAFSVDSDILKCHSTHLDVYNECESGGEVFITIWSTDPRIVEKSVETIVQLFTIVMNTKKWYHENR